PVVFEDRLPPPRIEDRAHRANTPTCIWRVNESAMNRHPLWERILRSRPSIEALEDRLLLSHTPLAPEFVVNTNLVAGAVAPPAIGTASDATGDFVVVWTNAISGKGTVYQVFAQRFNRDGVPQGPEIPVSPPNLLAAASGNGAVTVDVSMDA